MIEEMFWLLAALVVIQLLTFGYIFVLSYIAARKVRQVEDLVYSLFTQESPEKPSQFAELVDKVASVFSTRIITSAQAAIRGSAGGIAKGEAQAAQAELMASNPMMAMFAGGKLGKNPMALGLLSLLGQNLLNKQSSAVPSNGHSSPKFNL